MLRITALFAILGLACGAAMQVAQSPDAVTEPDVVCNSWTDCDAPCGLGSRSCDRSDGKMWTIDCHVQDCSTVDGCGNADVVFVLDSSASLGEKNWFKAKQFVIDVSKGLKISPDESRVGLVIYSNKGQKMFNLTDFESIDELEAAVWGVEHMAGNTNTFEGLMYAQEILDQTGREGMKHIVVVVTDGKSNNQAEKVAPQCEEMQMKGTEMFAVGVTNDVDTVEIDTIASEPTADHARYVADYDALVSITNEIIADTCDAAKRVECDEWSNWSACIVLDQTKDCGTGISSRARVCKFYTYPGQLIPETRIHTEHRPCDDTCGAKCASCSYDVHGVGYIPDDNCHGFIQCEYVGGSFIEHEKSCGGRFWRQDWLACVDALDSYDHCSVLPIVDAEEVTTPAFVCDKSPHATEVGKFVWHTNIGDVTMSCAFGTIFNDVSCQCVHGGGNGPAVCNSDALLEFPFNTHTNDICNRAAGTVLGNVTLVDGAAYFDGSSRVEVGYLKNYFANNPTTELTVTLWFKYTGSDNNRRGIFTNGDCVDDASVLVELANSNAQGQIVTDTQHQAVFGDGAATRDITADEWVFATMRYTGWDVKYFINGVEKSVAYSISGSVANTQCAANIGFSGHDNDLHYFQGYIDDVRVYRTTLWDAAITDMYNAGRQ